MATGTVEADLGVEESPFAEDMAAPAVATAAPVVADDTSETTSTEIAAESTAAPAETQDSAAEQSDAMTDEASTLPEGFGEALVSDAYYHGFTDADIADFPSPEALQRTLTALDRRDLASLGSEQEATTATAEGQSKETAATATSHSAEATATKTGDAATTAAQAQAAIDEFKIDLNPEEYDERIVATLHGLNGHYKGVVDSMRKQIEQFNPVLEQVKQLREQNEQFVAMQRADQQQRFNQQVDDFFSGLGSEFIKEFGKGDLQSIKPGSDEFKKRDAVVLGAMQLQRRDIEAGRQPPNLKKLLERSLKTEYWDQNNKLAVRKVAAEVEERKKASVARPTQRRSSGLTPDQVAAKRADDFYRSRGLDDGSAFEEERF